MDYYQRKERAYQLMNKMLDEGREDFEICFKLKLEFGIDPKKMLDEFAENKIKLIKKNNKIAEQYKKEMQSKQIEEKEIDTLFDSEPLKDDAKNEN